MLRTLGIRDFVIVERLDLEFEPGFTALTGETGAGKSILVDALALVLGERSDTGLVREGAGRAEISAVFALKGNTAATAWLEESELADEPGACILRRVLEASGRSRAYANGRPCTLQQLQALSARLVDIHGQHEHQSLLRAASQRELLDAFAGARGAAQEVESAWRRWQEVTQRRIESERNAGALAAERERVQWQVNELEQLRFAPEEWVQLQADHRRLAHAASLIEGAEQALESLSESDGSALAALNGALARLRSAQQIDASLNEVAEMLESARIQLQEAVYGLRHYRQRVDLDPARLRECEQRIEAVHATARKHRVSPEELPQLLTEQIERLEQLGAGLDQGALAKQEAEARAAFFAAGERLAALRREAAVTLSAEVSQAMQALAMRGGRFEVALESVPGGGAHGLEWVEFRVSPHRGAPLRPLAKIVSGGELSRLSLAVQTATSAVAQVPTLIFDEVDAGIGGGVAQIVGSMLKSLGRRHQVMCITHLPQVAASADHQWRVTRIETGGAARSRVNVLSRAERVEEIARMLGGVKITETTRRHAAELLGLTR